MKFNTDNKTLKKKVTRLLADPSPENIETFREWITPRLFKSYEYVHANASLMRMMGDQAGCYALLLEVARNEDNHWLSFYLNDIIETWMNNEVDLKLVLGFLILLNEIAEDNPEVIKKLIHTYHSLEMYNESIELLESAIEVFKDLFTIEDIAGYYIFSGEADHVKKGFDIINEYDISNHDPERQIGLGSLKFYAGHNYDGLVYHFGGEDFRPHHLVKKKAIPNGLKTDFNGKKVLITMYRGMGDSMILSRFIPKFYSKFPDCEIHVAAEKPLVPLYQTMESIARVGDEDSCAGIDYDYVLGVNMLSRYLREDLVDDQQRINYHEWVSYPQSYDDKWASLIEKPGPVIGLNWKGSQRLGGGPSSVNLSRDISFEDILPVIQLDQHATFVCLNPDISTDERSQLEEYPNVILPDVENFGDTAAIIKLCNVVVSIDTSISTLSASLSVDTIVMGKHVPDYRWLHYDKWWDLDKLNITVHKKNEPSSSWTSVVFATIKTLTRYGYTVTI